MPSISERKFTGVFILILILELITGQLDNLHLAHYFTKPLIVISLLFFFNTRNEQLSNSLKLLINLALVFSLIGDVALLFDSMNPIFFIVGLAAFLIAHVMYVLAFLKQRDSQRKYLVFVILLLGYAFMLFSILRDGLGTLLIPVLIYMIVILSMATTAYIRQKQDNEMSHKWVFFGAILFMVSDSILAIDKFYETFDLSSILIMSTYAFAQYCIVTGILKR